MLIALIAILLGGVANFAMHRWMLESGHPAVEAATGAMRRTLGRHSTYVVEFILLLTAALATEHSWMSALLLYGVYTVLNVGTVAWLKGPPPEN